MRVGNWGSLEQSTKWAGASGSVISREENSYALSGNKPPPCTKRVSQ